MKTRSHICSLLCLLSVLTGTLITATAEGVHGDPPSAEETVAKLSARWLNPEYSHPATQSVTAGVNATIQCPAHMLAYWHLDEETGSIHEDAYGGYDGLCASSCPTSTAGLLGGAQQFSRSERTAINVPGEPFNWEDNQSFSIEFWMMDPGDVSGDAVIVGRKDGGDPATLSWVGIGDGGLATFSLSAGAGDGTSIHGTTDLRLGGWHHVVAVYNDGDPGTLRLYVDAQEEALAAHDYASDFVTTTSLNIGWLDSTDGHHYDGILDELALYQRALTEKEIKSHYYLARGYCQMCQLPVRIMPLGDSITLGNASGAEPDDEAHWVSYRRDLWLGLVTGGYDVDFAGGQSGGYHFTPPFDSDHEGHSGWSDSRIRDHVIGFLTENRPDVVLLHIGTNALSRDPEQVEEILNQIDAVDEDITVVLARIIKRVWDTGGVTTVFNDNIQAMAEARMDPASPHYTGDKIIIVDMETGAGINYQLVSQGGDMYNGVHPYKTGYVKMANVWLNGDSHGSDGLADFLPACRPPVSPVAPYFVSPDRTTFVVGKPGTFTVRAAGVPTPTIALSGTLPVGVAFTDNGDRSATLSGAPAVGSAGAYPLTLTAINAVTPDGKQAFTLIVKAEVYLPLLLSK